MNYKEKYEAIMNDIDAAILGARDEKTKITLENIKSRNTESEDERIRKEIIAFLKHYHTGEGDSVPYNDDWIIYLEKKKENPKSADSISADCVSSAKCENEHNNPGDFVFELRQLISRHRYADMYGEYTDDEEGMAREILSLCEKQKEQKPAEKQDYSGLNDLERAILRGFLATGVENVPVTIIKETAKECLAQMKPAEWSEEDEKKLTTVISLMRTNRAVDPFYDKMCLESWLKSLRPPLKDKEMKLKILKYLSTRCSSLEFEEVEEYLNNLRPSWKPSEEQIYSLGTVVKGAGENSVGSVAYNLKELYEQLKALM